MRARNMLLIVLLIGALLLALSYMGNIRLSGGPNALMPAEAGNGAGVGCGGSAPADYCDGKVAKTNATCVNGQWAFNEENCYITCENAKCVAYKCDTDCNDGNDATADVCNIFTGKCEHYVKVRPEGQSNATKAPGGVLVFMQGADNSLIYQDYFKVNLLKAYRQLTTVTGEDDYFVIEMSAQNMGNVSREFNPQMTLVDNAGIEHAQMSKCGKDGGEIRTGNLGAGETVTGKVCFEDDVHAFPLRLYMGKWYGYVLITEDFVGIKRSSGRIYHHGGASSASASPDNTPVNPWLPPASGSGPAPYTGEAWLPQAG